MLSRVAESMYWLSRYMERAENTARFLDVHSQLLLDLNKITRVDSAVGFWEPLVRVASDWEHFQEDYKRDDAQAVTEFLVFSRGNPNSIASCVAMARENARTIIESITSEMWEEVNGLYLTLQRRTPGASMGYGADGPYGLLNEVKKASHQFQGITDCTLSRSEGWDFIQAGKYLERADNTCRLVDEKYRLLGRQAGSHYGSVDVIEWMAVLKSCCALEPFRKVYLSKIEPDTILQYLMLDRDFPRSVYFSLAATEEVLWRISGGSRHKHVNAADQEIGKLVGELSGATVAQLYGRGLETSLADLKGRIAQAGSQIHETYFAYHAPNAVPSKRAPAPAFIGLTGAHALWSQAEQQQQQQQ